MTEAYVLAGVLAGAACTLLAVWALSIQRAAREVSETAKAVRALARALEPTALRLGRLSAAAEQSEPDLRRMQLALRRFSEGSVELGEAFARTSGWIGVALPLVIAAFERWTQGTEADAEADDDAQHSDGRGQPHGYPRAARTQGAQNGVA